MKRAHCPLRFSGKARWMGTTGGGAVYGFATETATGDTGEGR